MDSKFAPRGIGRRPFLVRAGLAGAGLAAPVPTGRALAQAGYPDRPIRVIVPFGAGTSTDILTRLISPRMSQSLGQPVVVENRPGAGSDAVAKAPPDGYTLCMGSIASHSINVALMPKLPYDVSRDFVPISLVTNAPNLLVVGPQVPVRTLPEFLAWSRQQIGGASYASAGNGTSSHLAGELLRLRTGAPLVHVPYRSGAQAVTDVVAGHVPMLVYQVAAVLPFVRDGRLRALAAASTRRLEWAPEVPTALEQGVPDFDVSAWHGLFAPAGLPAPVLERVFGALTEALTDPEVRPKLAEQGLEPVGMAPAEFRRFLQADIAKWRGVVRAANIKPG